MNSYAIYELKCPACDLQYHQVISQSEEDLVIPCPACGSNLRKIKQLTGTELLSCVSSYGGS